MNKYLTFITILVSLLLFLAAKRCRHYQRIAARGQSEVTTRQDSFATIYNRDHRAVAEQKPLIRPQDLKKLTTPVFNLAQKEEKKIKKVYGYTAVNQQMRIKGVVPYDTVVVYDTVYVHKDEWAIRPEKRFFSQTTDYAIGGTISSGRIVIDSLLLENRLQIRLVQKTEGFLKPTSLTVQVLNSNPYVRITGMQSMRLPVRPNAWNRWIKPTLAAGAAAYLTYKIAKP